MPTDPPSEIISILRQREEFIRSLLDGPKEKPELVDELDVSRSTVDRGIRELRNLGLVEPSSEGLRPTLSGKLMYEAHTNLKEKIEAVLEAQELLMVLDFDAKMDFEILIDADISISEGPSPNEGIQELYELQKGADRRKGLARSITFERRFVNTFYDGIFKDNMEFEFVFQTNVIEHLISKYKKKFSDIIYSDRVDAYEIDGKLPYGLAIVEIGNEKTVFVLVYDEGGKLRGVIKNGTPEAVRWGEEAYEYYRSKATKIRSLEGG
ncbi:MAG: ArsR family transcriptional regulator [Halobacteria archaeon]|nr:ArsR family transcriptional regulator [Halobacteria archaeon]